MQTTLRPGFRKTVDTFTSGATTLPQRYFVSPELFAKDRENIFSRQWVLVGHQSQIAKAGDYFVREVAGESLRRPPASLARTKRSLFERR